MDLKSKEERANRRMWGRVFLSFFFFSVGCGGFILIWFYIRFSIFLFICLPPRQLDNSEKDGDLGVCMKDGNGADKEWASASGRKGVGALGNRREEM